VAHDSPHFRWLVDDPDCLIDMGAAGNLSARLAQLSAGRATLCRRSPERARRARARFDWGSLAPQYVGMYRRVAAAERGGGR
jgi:hypothetical protein